MVLRTLALLIGFALSLGSSSLVAQVVGADQSDSSTTGKLSPARAAAVAKRRTWLRTRLARDIKDPARFRLVTAQLDRMSADQIDELSARYLQQLKRRRKDASQQRAELRKQAELVASQQSTTAAGNRVSPLASPDSVRPGFVPIISWFPVGASFTGSAVISPDGRFVRVNAFPFFSSLGPVHGFNFYNGNSWLLHPGVAGPVGHHHHVHHHGRHQHGHPHHHTHQRGRYHPPKVWYDGFRTRVGR